MADGQFRTSHKCLSSINRTRNRWSSFVLVTWCTDLNSSDPRPLKRYLLQKKKVEYRAEAELILNFKGNRQCRRLPSWCRLPVWHAKLFKWIDLTAVAAGIRHLLSLSYPSIRFVPRRHECLRQVNFPSTGEKADDSIQVCQVSGIILKLIRKVTIMIVGSSGYIYLSRFFSHLAVYGYWPKISRYTPIMITSPRRIWVSVL